MTSLRAFLRTHRALAILAVALALCLKAAIPAGFMIGPSEKVLRVTLCHDGIGPAQTARIVIPVKSDDEPAGNNASKTDCPYSALSMAGTGALDDALYIAALLFILALGFAPIRRATINRRVYLRPPLRGPPLTS